MWHKMYLFFQRAYVMSVNPQTTVDKLKFTIKINYFLSFLKKQQKSFFSKNIKK